jgi:hypothetical protein
MLGLCFGFSRLTFKLVHLQDKTKFNLNLTLAKMADVSYKVTNSVKFVGINIEYSTD